MNTFALITLHYFSPVLFCSDLLVSCCTEQNAITNTQSADWLPRDVSIDDECVINRKPNYSVDIAYK